MNIYEFLQKLNIFYPSNKSDSDFTEIINEYANNILEFTRKSNKKYDYQKVFNHILQNYKYKTFPSLPDILESIPFGEVIEINYSGREGTEIKKLVNGHEYLFTIVPSNWNVKTISELDNDIKVREEKSVV